MVQSVQEKRALHSSKAFFSENELKYCDGRIESFTGLICVKESCIKALSNLNEIPSYSYKDFELHHYKNGKPYLVFDKALKKYMQTNQLKSDVTISHTQLMASAIVIIYKGN